jgi:hypothetical protein
MKTDANTILQAKMKKELAAYLEAEREKLRAKGITVFPSEESLRKEHPKLDRLACGLGDDPAPRTILDMMIESRSGRGFDGIVKVVV